MNDEAQRCIRPLRERYDEDGFVFPLEALSAREALELGAEIASMSLDHRLSSHPVPTHQKVNLLFPAVDAIVQDERITTLAAAALGEEDLVSMSVDLFIKPGNSTKYISWHQDSYYIRQLEEGTPALTAVLALSSHTITNGCLRYSRGSHARGVLPHHHGEDGNNVLTQKQTIAAAELGEEVHVELQPGQVSLHAWNMPHASGPNETPDARVGLAIRYMPTRARCVTQPCDPPVTVRVARGTDRYGYFPHDDHPDEALSDHSLRLHTAALEPHAANSFSSV